MSGLGFKEIKCNHERNPLVKLKVVNCLISNVEQNYMEKEHLRLGAWWLLVNDVTKDLNQNNQFRG